MGDPRRPGAFPIVHEQVSLDRLRRIRKPDAAHGEGQSKVVTQGRTGYHASHLPRRRCTTARSITARHQADRASRPPLATSCTTAPRRPPAAASADASTDASTGTRWPVCESGNNPRAVGGGGSYFGLYQFTVGTWHSVGRQRQAHGRVAGRADQAGQAPLSAPGSRRRGRCVVASSTRDRRQPLRAARAHPTFAPSRSSSGSGPPSSWDRTSSSMPTRFVASCGPPRSGRTTSCSRSGRSRVIDAGPAA